MKEASQNLNDVDEEDEYTAFGIHIAKQLRKLSYKYICTGGNSVNNNSMQATRFTYYDLCPMS